MGDAFRQRFNAELEDDAINKSHQIIIVAAELDPSTERIVDYLSKNGISINVLFFKVFQHGDEQFLSRARLIDRAKRKPMLRRPLPEQVPMLRNPGMASFMSRSAIRKVASGKRHVDMALSVRVVEAGIVRL